MIDINWFAENYIEDDSRCLFLLKQAEDKYSFTMQDFYIGCFELRKIKTDKGSLQTHLLLLGNMGNVGINAHIAGVKLRDAFLETAIILGN